MSWEFELEPELDPPVLPPVLLWLLGTQPGGHGEAELVPPVLEPPLLEPGMPWLELDPPELDPLILWSELEPPVLPPVELWLLGTQPGGHGEAELVPPVLEPPELEPVVPWSEGVRRSLAWFDADLSRRTIDLQAEQLWDQIISAYLPAFPSA